MGIKITLRVVFWGGLMVFLAPEQMVMSGKALLSGLGEIGSGIGDLVVSHAKDTAVNFVNEGWAHPTQGAIGWKVIGWIKGWFN